jgi:CRP/FNR family transcriptional regulator, cyclic AMP receptor protein
MNEQYAQIMTTFPLLKGLTQHGAEMLLAAGEIKNYRPGELLCKEGDPASFTLMILTGKIEVFVGRAGKDVLIREVEPGAILGELGVLCGLPRTASLRSSGESAVVQWTTAEFRRVLLRNPNLYERITAQSLRGLIEKERSLIDSMPPEQAAD